MKSSISTNIKKRTIPNDVFITPLLLAKTAIDLIDYNAEDIWLNPFKNDGSYYNQYPDKCNKKWCEILDNVDFFDFNEPITILCSNPPWSCLDKVIEKSINLNPRVINYLIGINNLTARRLEMFEKADYKLTKLHMCKVFNWYGMSIIVQFEKNKKSIISYDRIVWR